ncbi:MAG: PfkB family carbohydrate kinase, partial [Bryobacteraceae bacterium]
GSWKPRTEDLLPYVSVAICSANFLPPGYTNTDDVVEYLVASGVTQVAVSHGDRPILVRDGSGASSIPVRGIRPVDTLGAGDVLHGAFCFAFAHGLSFRASLVWAAEIATISCEYLGARSWIRERAPLPRLLANE